MKIIFRDEIGCCTAIVDDSIMFEHNNYNGNTFVLFECAGEDYKINVKDVLGVEN